MLTSRDWLVGSASVAPAEAGRDRMTQRIVDPSWSFESFESRAGYVLALLRLAILAELALADAGETYANTTLTALTEPESALDEMLGRAATLNRRPASSAALPALYLLGLVRRGRDQLRLDMLNSPHEAVSEGIELGMAASRVIAQSQNIIAKVRAAFAPFEEAIERDNRSKLNFKITQEKGTNTNLKKGEPIRTCAKSILEREGYRDALSLSAVTREVLESFPKKDESGVRNMIKPLFEKRPDGSKGYRPRRPAAP